MIKKGIGVKTPPIPNPKLKEPPGQKDWQGEQPRQPVLDGGL